MDLFHHRLASARDAQAEPDAKGGEEDGHEGAVKLDRVLDDNEAVFGVLQDGDEQAADKTEDEDMALHGELGRSVMERSMRGALKMGRPCWFRVDHENLFGMSDTVYAFSPKEPRLHSKTPPPASRSPVGRTPVNPGVALPRRSIKTLG